MYYICVGPRSLQFQVFCMYCSSVGILKTFYRSKISFDFKLSSCSCTGIGTDLKAGRMDFSVARIPFDAFGEICAQAND